MNVIKYDIEVKKKKKYFFEFWKDVKQDSISNVITNSFIEELDYTGDFKTTLRKEWEHLGHSSIKNLNHSNYLVGYITVNNTKVFLFEIINTGLKGKNNKAIQVYAFGTVPIDDILNESFTKIKDILSDLNCQLVNKSHIHIFPYNSKDKDIESSDLKIKADLVSSVKIDVVTLIRWGLVIIASLISLAWYFSLPAEDNLLKNTLFSVFGSGLFYIVLDVIISFVVPYFSNGRKKTVIISDLSSVIERGDEMIDGESSPVLVIPTEEK